MSWPSVRLGGVEGGRSDRRGGRRKEDGRRKREYVCDVCGGHYAEPGVVARQRLSAPTYSHHPRQPQNPLLSLPYFTSWRTISFF